MEKIDWIKSNSEQGTNCRLKLYTYNNKVYINAQGIDILSDSSPLECIIYKDETYIDAKYLNPILDSVSFSSKDIVIRLKSHSMKSTEFDFIQKVFIGDNKYVIDACYDYEYNCFLAIGVERTPIKLG
jgi:hypothetical protein